MKKIGAFVILILLTFSLIVFAIAAEGDDCTTDDDCGSGEICEIDLCILEDTTTEDTVTSQQDPDKIEEGFDCLEEKVDDDCSDADTVQELALTILATPDNVFDECVDKLLDEESGNHFGTVRDTGLAILALNHAGEDTEDYEEWLLKQNTTPSDLIWYLEQDSNSATQCKISYDSDDYTVNINDNKKLDSNAGSCLTRAVSNFWLKVDPDCYDEEFQVSCDEDFIATLLYKNQNSATIYVLEGTESEPAYGTISLQVRSQCFPSSANGNSCDYEATIWSTLALLETGHEIDDFIPYIVAMSDSNEKYLPNSFIYMLTNFEDYASTLIKEQNLGNYWLADSTAYNKYYDTSLALIALGSSSADQVVKARDWLLFSQSTDGCWGNSIRDTAIVLWALEGRAGRSGSGSSVTRCTDAGFYCITREECPDEEDVGNNYFCSSLSDTCCKSENLQSCSAYGGQECDLGYACTGNERKSLDADACCVGECVEIPETAECEELGYICKSECSDNQEEIDYSCDGTGGVCCRTKSGGGSLWWLWLIIILIVIALGVLGWIYREKVKLWLFKIKSKFKRDKSGSKSGPSRPSGPPAGFPGIPRPGFPPIRRPSAPVGRPSQYRKSDRRDSAMQDVFQKLKDMAK